MPVEQTALAQEALAVSGPSVSEPTAILPPVLTVDELAAFLRVDRKTVYNTEQFEPRASRGHPYRRGNLRLRDPALVRLEVLNRRYAAQIEQVLSRAAIAGAIALASSDVRQSVLDSNPRTQAASTPGRRGLPPQPLL